VEKRNLESARRKDCCPRGELTSTNKLVGLIDYAAEYFEKSRFNPVDNGYFSVIMPENKGFQWISRCL